MIRIARLSLWSRILCKTPEVVKSLCFDMAKVNVGWPSAVYGDLKWASGATFFQAAVGRSFEDWAAYIGNNSKYFRGQIKKFSKLRYANIPPVGPGSRCSSEQSATFSCSQIGCPFKTATKQQLAVHMFKIHKIKSMWKNYLGDYIHCPICLKLFHTRQRVLNHVRYRSEVCRHNLV